MDTKPKAKGKAKPKSRILLESLIDAVSTALAEQGFLYDTNKLEFRRIRNEFTDRIIIRVARSPAGAYRISLYTIINLDKIEDLVVRLIPNAEADVVTFGQLCTNVGPKMSRRFPIDGSFTVLTDDPKNWSNALQKVKSFLVGYVLPWFTRYQTRTAIFDSLTTDPALCPEHQTPYPYEKAALIALLANDSCALLQVRREVERRSQAFKQSYQAFYDNARAAYPNFFPELNLV